MPKKNQPGCGCCGNMRRCCEACENATPMVWTGTLGGIAFTLSRATVTIENKAICTWETAFATDQTLGDCTTIRRFVLQFAAQTSPNGPPYKPTFSAYNSSGNTVIYWEGAIRQQIDCQSALTLTWEAATGDGDCGFTDSVTLTPYSASNCCCPGCNANGTPHKFGLTSAGGEFAYMELEINWATCDVGSSPIYELQFSPITVAGCSVNYAILQPNIGGLWQLKMYTLATPGTALVWESASPTESLPIDCTDVTKMNLEPATSTCGPPTANVGLSPLHIKTCDTSSGGRWCEYDFMDPINHPGLPGGTTLDWDVDFGAGGWTSGVCSECADVAGVFQLSNDDGCVPFPSSDFGTDWFPYCHWVLDYRFCTEESPNLVICATVANHRTAGTTDYWAIWLGVHFGLQSVPGSPYAYYKSAQYDMSTSPSWPVTLTKFDEFTDAASWCDGALPNTITITEV